MGFARDTLATRSRHARDTLATLPCPPGGTPWGNYAKHKILWSPRLRTIAGIGFRRRLERGRRNISRITPFRLSNHWEIPIHSVSLGVSPGGKPSWIRAQEFHHRFPQGLP